MIDNKKILVIGDSCKDVFRYGICERLCPEAPVPVFKPQSIRVNGGMCLNVVENIKSLGGDCDLITNTVRPSKTRLVDEVSNQIIVRIDEFDDDVEPIDIVDGIDIENYGFDNYSAVVISDYDKGFLDENEIKYLTKLHNLVFLDTKKKLDDWALGVEIIKINYNEYLKNIDWLEDEFKGDLIVTKGSEGAILNHDTEFKIETEHPVRDLSGAGDTFLAALVVEYLKKNNVKNAIKFANKCASWVVTQKGVVAVNPQMI